jgi:hypothetical protein
VQNRSGIIIRRTLNVVCSCCLVAGRLLAQAPVTLIVDTAHPQFRIPDNFAGLGFETKSVLPNAYHVQGYFFSPTNSQLITLFRNIGVHEIRVGGGTVDGSGSDEHCVTPTPTFEDIDHLFAFARAAGVKIIYSVRLLNVDSCANPHLAEDDARSVRYIWQKYRTQLDSFSIGNEPDVRSFHSRPDHVVDPAIFESVPGVPGSAYASYFAQWRKFAEVIRKAAPGARFSGPDTAVSDTSSFTPDPSQGVSWTMQFASDLKSTGMLVEALQHHYVWGLPVNTTTQEAIDDMLSSSWDDGAAIGTQPARGGKTAEFHPYLYVYEKVLAPLVALGIPYRMTEANDCLHGVPGASDGFASALWSLDYMHWWAAHRMAGVNFHNNPWLPTDTIVPDPNPCTNAGCANYRVTPKAYGVKAFDLGSHGFVEPIAMANPQKINLTAYAVGTSHELYVTIINKTHSATHDATDASVLIDAAEFDGAGVDSMVLTDGVPGNAALSSATLGGAAITNRAPWAGKWTRLGCLHDGKFALTVKSTTAAIVRIRNETVSRQCRGPAE